MSPTNTAVIFVDSKKKYGDQSVPAVKIIGVSLITRILNDLRRIKIKRIFVVSNEDNLEIKQLVETSRAESKYFLLSDNTWRTEISDSDTKNILVLPSDRLSDYRFLRSLINADSDEEKALITVDFKKPDEKHLAETEYYPNEGKIIPDREVKNARETGINIVPAKAVTEFEDCDSKYLQTQAKNFLQNGKADYFDIANGFVETVDSEKSIKIAGSRLIRYVWKEIDGIHTRPTKRALIPIIKLLLKTPITPNMITIMGLLVSLVAGYAYSRGRYIDFVLGAIIAFISMLFDHLDGCIARVKSLESDFGAYFDTVCDYVFYISFGVGMTVGLYRSSGNYIYIYLGIAALFGILVSLITSSYQRKTYAQDASLYAHEAHIKLENDQSAIVRWGRKSYFVMRRGVMPFYLFIFTVLGLLPFILFMTALGSNLFWMYHLYTNKLYSPKTKI